MSPKHAKDAAGLRKALLAWYDAVPWALAALQPVSRYHRILLAHTGMLALAYLPGRVVALPPGLGGATTVLRSAVSPLVLGVLLIVAFTGSTQRSGGTLGETFQ